MPETSRKALVGLSLRSYRDVLHWASGRGLMPVCVVFYHRPSLPYSSWSVIYGEEIVRDFDCIGSSQKRVQGELARAYASERYEVDNWFRLGGIENALFSEALVSELKRELPHVRIRKSL